MGIKKGAEYFPRYHPGLLLVRLLSEPGRSALPIGQKRSRAMFAAAAGLLFTKLQLSCAGTLRLLSRSLRYTVPAYYT